MIKNWSRRRRIAGLVLLLGLLWYIFCLPASLFQTPRSFVLESSDGRLLGAQIAGDGQWRFPDIDSVPTKFSAALIEFEDRRFYHHLGIDLRAMARAIGQNIRAKRIVSGGSTLSMQVMRLSRENKGRTLWQKLVETVQATRLEWSYSKQEILGLYASNAPFGGNVVGLEAASWRYYGKSPHLLSWAEAATLAVLPNSPGLIHPGRNRDALLAKRNRLLDRLFQSGQIEALDCQLAKEEPLPEKPLPLPQMAPHLLERARKEALDETGRLHSTVDFDLQNRLNTLTQQQLSILQQNGINNLAVLVLEIKTGRVLAYLGNAPGTGGENQEYVDIIKARRSTGSILKPFLFARMVETGALIPNTLVSDIPTYISGYKPENFNLQHAGAIPAKTALARSLNVPFVRMLQDYGLEKFHFDLQRLGIGGLRPDPDHYGLTLILGGAESSLWEICNVYAAMARNLRFFYERQGTYDANEFRPSIYSKDQPLPDINLLKQPPLLSAGSIWLTFEAMQELERPDSEGAWRKFSSSRQIAWKTGTSFGFRDAWAVGIDSEYLVGVWAGNADGEGRPGLVGVRAAAPVMFQVFDLLPATTWFERPDDELIPTTFCAQSGYRAGKYCPVDTLDMPRMSQQVDVCPFHQLIHYDPVLRQRVNSSCAQVDSWENRSWFVLPPVEEYYYLPNHPEYAPLPPFKQGCTDPDENAVMQFIYPHEAARIYVPVNLDGSRSATIFRAAHRRADSEIFWHLDNAYIGSTKTFHEIELDPEPGKHRITLVDEKGVRLSQTFEIIPKERK
ncbi:MAG: penicillin-binding protein 1C [Saprospiraceae bacterium]|nr:penicillin-binding protein 1C [Saprospiraceae bacterium]